MPTYSRRGSWFTVACVLLLGLFLLRNGSAEGSGGPPQPPSAVAARYGASDTLPARPDPLPRSVPRRISVPSVALDAPLTEAGLDAGGWVEAPPLENGNLAGWYTGAVTPGERGTAVIVGHVDNTAGPAAFFALGAVKRGSEVEILRGDGRTAVFAVYGVEVLTKKNFPAARVYQDTPEPELRVITCGGGYSKKTGYDGNVVAFARLAKVR
ncbi:class F sortase [Streptomyces lunaelactis]|uniref:class F sortase n=2 Tax=Streptomyces lunaelactis TaxID=1535768 RepID=UPI001584777B|nr:class F sortase [Streptomyces lunaelactis]NUL28964.1 class F sortase [Streptomyces lunaelactis]